MKFVATIEARMGSTRLPGKTLRPILGKPMLEWMIERVKRAQEIDEIVIATSVNKLDDPIEALAKRLGVGVFRGSEEDVMDRVLSAARQYRADHIVELWGDTVLIDPAVIDQAIRYYREQKLDCVSTFLDKQFPFGISLLVFSFAVLDEAARMTNDPVDRENVSTYIYFHPEKYKIGNLPCPVELRRPELRLVVDELPDFEMIAKIFEHFQSIGKSEFGTKEIIDFLDAHPELKAMNRTVKQRVVNKKE